MRKIPSLFQRNHDVNKLIRDEVTPGAEWVTSGEGIATRKFDGTCCMVRDRQLYKRYDVRPGKTPPANFEPAQAADAVTGHWPGWVPVGVGPEDRWHREAVRAGMPPDGTYELVGPKVNGNPECFAVHLLVAHGGTVLPDVPRDFAGLKDYLSTHAIEGIVWHHQDGRMVKVKTTDFGLRRRLVRHVY